MKYLHTAALLTLAAVLAVSAAAILAGAQFSWLPIAKAPTLSDAQDLSFLAGIFLLASPVIWALEWLTEKY